MVREPRAAATSPLDEEVMPSRCWRRISAQQKRRDGNLGGNRENFEFGEFYFIRVWPLFWAGSRRGSQILSYDKTGRGRRRL